MNLCLPIRAEATMEKVEDTIDPDLETKFTIRNVLDYFMQSTVEWFGFKEADGDQLRTSKGLRSTYIDMSRFNNEPLIKDGLLPQMFGAFITVLTGVTKARRDYFKALKAPPANSRHASPDLWEEVKRKASSLGIGVIGFAPVDENLIFRHDHVGRIGVLYENGIVLGMEMDFDAIDQAPEAAAGLEAMRVYGALGKATNELADFIRSRGFKAIACHPLGGPILFPAMAEKANMGQMGKLGLLITKEYGPRLRLSMIATNASPLPEEPRQDFGIREFCEKCGLCIRKCPAGAIRKEPLENRSGTHSCVASEKCFTQFYEKDGCSVCIKACPFHSKGYDRVMGAMKKAGKKSPKGTSPKARKKAVKKRKA